MRSKLMILLATSAVIGLITPSAEAFQLKINGSTVFLATHEGHSVAVSPAAGDPDIGSYNVMVEDTAMVYSSDALYGDRSIDISGAARGALGVDGLSTAIGDVIEVSGAIKNEGDQYFGIRFGGTGIYNGHGGGIRMGPGTINFVGDPGGPWGGAWETASSALVQFSGGSRTETIRTGLTTGEWHTYVFTHTVGSTTLNVNIDGTVTIEGSFTPEPDPETPNAGDSIVNGLWMIDPYNASGPVHYDAMPEPASLALLGAGGLLLLSRRRRKA